MNFRLKAEATFLKGGSYFPERRKLLEQNAREEVDDARIPRLTELQHRLPPHFRVVVRPRDLHQLRNAFVVRKPAERTHGLLFYFGVGVLLERGINDRQRLIGCTLSQPEQ